MKKPVTITLITTVVLLAVGAFLYFRHKKKKQTDKGPVVYVPVPPQPEHETIETDLEETPVYEQRPIMIENAIIDDEVTPYSGSTDVSGGLAEHFATEETKKAKEEKVIQQLLISQ